MFRENYIKIIRYNIINMDFKVGNFHYNPNKNNNLLLDYTHISGGYRIQVLKRTNKMLYLRICYYNGYLYDLEDVLLTRKIYKDDNGEEYLKTIWFDWNTPHKNESERYDCFTIRAKHLNSNEVIDDD
jgi:hypothetical protein